MELPLTLVRMQIGLLVFILGMYALLSRDRRSPYLVVTAYDTIVTVLAALLLAQVSKWAPCPWSTVLEIASTVLTLGVLAVLMWRILYLANRDRNLRDDQIHYALPGVGQVTRALKRWLRKRKARSYEHHPVVEDLSEAIQIVRGKAIGDSGASSSDHTATSVFLHATSFAGATSPIVLGAAWFLRKGHSVQYTTCARHPIQFVEHLENELGKEWSKHQSRVVLVDAYTPHFGFSDSILDYKTAAVHQSFHVEIQTTKPSFAGLHTAAAKAFKTLKKNAEKTKPRGPTLVIYEGVYLLSDLESIEQYHVFMNHVVPSERMWGSMLTLIVEAGMPQADRRRTRAHCDIPIVLQ